MVSWKSCQLRLHDLKRMISSLGMTTGLGTVSSLLVTLMRAAQVKPAMPSRMPFASTAEAKMQPPPSASDGMPGSSLPSQTATQWSALERGWFQGGPFVLCRFHAQRVAVNGAKGQGLEFGLCAEADHAYAGASEHAKCFATKAEVAALTEQRNCIPSNAADCVKARRSGKCGRSSPIPPD